VNPLRASGRPWVVGHRGAAARAPENTLPSFRTAWAAGAGWVEADVQPTADDVPVILHDDDLDRTTDGTGPLRSRAAHAVATLDAGRWFGAEFAGTRVPTLADLLSALDTGDRRLLLEIKGDHTPRQIQVVIDRIRAARAGERVFLESFELDALRMVRQILPDEPVGLLVERIDDDPVEACRQIGATAYNPEFGELLARPDLVRRLHEAEIAVMVWTVNRPPDWARLTELGVDAIITDDPGALLAWQAGR
jgi:glycerophosphoryl diester phosphodiesterase